MRRLTCAALVLLLVAGCNGVYLNAEYSQLLDETAAWTNEAACRAEDGRLDPNETARALRLSADHWRRFQDARDGRAPDED